MRIGIVGAGPAGLYFGLLIKRRFPDWPVRIVEQNPADATFGFGVVFSGRALAFLEQGDPDIYRTIASRMETWPELTIVLGDERVAIDGNRYSAIGRLQLLRILQGLCADAGVGMTFGTQVADLAAFADCDLVVGADGANSKVRELHRDTFEPRIDYRPNKFVWYGTRQIYESLTLTFRHDGKGAFVGHHYRYSPEMSTFIVEVDAASWHTTGLDRMTDAERRAYSEGVFEQDLGGHGFVTNKSIWRNFPDVSNRNWVAGNVVLLGDALRTAHFSIGSGTRLAMEDAIALAGAVEAHTPDVPACLQAFEAARRPIVDKFIAAARNSYVWYEAFAEHMDRPALDFAYDYMTRSGRVDAARLRASSPGFMRRYRAHKAAHG